MRHFLLSDVHANVAALMSVLAHAQVQGWDAVISLGDTVGYGSEPNVTLDRLRALEPYKALCGNHEAALLEALSGERGARAAANYEPQAWALSEATR